MGRDLPRPSCCWFAIPHPLGLQLVRQPHDVVGDQLDENLRHLRVKLVAQVSTFFIAAVSRCSCPASSCLVTMPSASASMMF